MALNPLTKTNEPQQSDYYWDFVATQTAMGRYITEMEKAFILKSFTTRETPLDLVVDAGAGSGRFSRVVAPLTKRVVATELEESLVKALAKVAPNVSPILVAPGTTCLPVASNSTDCILCIEAVFLSEQEWFYEECTRILKAGGLVIITLQNRRSWKGLLARMRPDRYRYTSGDIYYAHSVSEFSERFRGIGLELEEARGYNWLPFNRDSKSPLAGWLAKLEGLLQLRRLPSLSPWVILRYRYVRPRERNTRSLAGD